MTSGGDKPQPGEMCGALLEDSQEDVGRRMIKYSIFCAYRMDAYITTIAFIQSKGAKTAREFEDMKFTLNMQADQEKIVYLRCVILVLRSHQTRRDSKDAPSVRIYTIFFSFLPYNIIIIPLLVQCSITNHTVL